MTKHNMKDILRLSFIIAVTVLLLAGLSLPVLAQNEKNVLTLMQYGNSNGDVKAGQDNIFYFEVGNYGNTALNNIVFTALVPEYWTAAFDPDSIAILDPGEYVTVKANIVPVTGDERNNYITFIAQSTETRQTLSVYTRLEKTTGFWMWVGAGVAAVCVAVFIWIFFRLNRIKA